MLIDRPAFPFLFILKKKGSPFAWGQLRSRTVSDNVSCCIFCLESLNEILSLPRDQPSHVIDLLSNGFSRDISSNESLHRSLSS